MKISGEAKLLRIFLGESDKVDHVPVYEKIVMEARKCGIAGATVYRGIMGYGGNSRIHFAKFLTISTDLPLVIEIVDGESKINKFIPKVEEIFEKADSGGLITLEKAEIIRYTASDKKPIIEPDIKNRPDD
jgi:PII-like signaling protein